MVGLVALVSLMATASAGEQVFPAVPVVASCPGEDWSLPERLVPRSDSGFFTMDVRSKRPEVAHDGHTLTWAKLQPEEERYDFSRVHEILRGAASEGRGVVLRLKASVARRRSVWGPLSAVPSWVLAKHAPPLGRIRDRGPSDFIEIVPPWHPGVQADYLRFVKAFGREHFERYASLLGIYVHGISTSFGEEMWMDRRGYEGMLELGMTPDRLEAAMEARIRAWAEAFEERPGLLAWVGAGWIDASEDRSAYRAARSRLDALALRLGLGRRWGNIEKYNGNYTHNGQSVAADGRLQTDLSYPLIAERRFWAAENENYGARSEMNRFVYRMAILRALQMRIRLLWVTDHAVAFDPVLSDYYTRVAGRNEEESPDAWVLLRETDVMRGKDYFRVGNFERGLAQIEPDASSRTLRSLPVERPPQAKDWKEAIEWSARRTDRESGSDRIRIQLEDRFVAIGEALPRTLQLTWRDDGQQWRLEVHSARGTARSTPIRGDGSGLDRTTTFLLPEPSKRRPDETGSDFSFVSEQRDLVAKRVRVLRNVHRPQGRGCEESS